jgi:UDPglucose 6-dehydrogenase
MARKVVAALNGDVRGKKIAVLGLTFKPETDDMRDAPSISIIQALQDGGAEVFAYDPEGMEASRAMLDNMTYGTSPYDIAEGADALVIVTEWNQFRALDFQRLRTIMGRPLVVDLRNVYKPDEVKRHGFAYVSVGRGTSPMVVPVAEAAE